MIPLSQKGALRMLRVPRLLHHLMQLTCTLRRECLDFLIPLSEYHLRRLLKAWVLHYNTSRLHMSLGPGIPQPPASLPVPLQAHRHRLPKQLSVVSHQILSGLQHAYGLAEKVA